MTSSSIVWAARGQSAWKSTSLRHQFHAPSLNSCGLFEFHLAEAQLDPSTCFGRHGSATDKKEDTFPPYTSQTNTSYRSQLSGRRPLHTPQPFPGSKHKKTWLLTIQCCLTVNSIGPHAIASFLDRCLLEMDMAHAIPGSDPSLKHVAKFVLSTKTDTSLRQIHDLTEQNPNTKWNLPENPSKIFPCKCKVSSLEKKTKSLNLLETSQPAQSCVKEGR